MNWLWNDKKKEYDGYPLFELRTDGSVVEINRVPWDNYFIKIADEVSTRGTCDRKQVGCVLVNDKRILATGYNGSISGLDHCDDVGHMMENDHCIRTVHAEVNALAQCAKYGIPCDGATAYINTYPCWDCFKALVNAGIKKIFWKDEYNSWMKGPLTEAADKLNIPLERI